MAENVQRQYVHLRKQRIMEYLQNAPAELSSFEDNNKEQVIETPKLERKLLSQDKQLIQTIEGYPSENTNDTNKDVTNSTLLLEEKQIFIRKYLKQTIEERLEKFVSLLENKDLTLEELLCEQLLLDRVSVEPIDETLLTVQEKEREQKVKMEEEILKIFAKETIEAQNGLTHKSLEKTAETIQKFHNNTNSVTEGRSFIIKTIIEIHKKYVKTEKNSKVAKVFESTTDGMVVIGPNGTKIALEALQAINWSLSGTAITRKILVEVFGREILAFHSLTGKPSPAFMGCNKPIKNHLDQGKVQDVLHFIMQHTKLTEKEVRSAIITKCADENKMYRQREKKRLLNGLKLQKKSKI